jgi:hypothetical protein
MAAHVLRGAEYARERAGRTERRHERSRPEDDQFPALNIDRRHLERHFQVLETRPHILGELLRDSPAPDEASLGAHIEKLVLA